MAESTKRVEVTARTLMRFTTVTIDENQDMIVPCFAFYFTYKERKKGAFTVYVGQLEFQRFKMVREKLTTARPSIHDVFMSMAVARGAIVEKVLIHSIIGRVFRARIFIRDENGGSFNFDSRPSDALIMAFLFDCPIYANVKLLENNHVGLDYPDETSGQNHDSSESIPDLASMPTDDLLIT